jgi:hypothetical protein
MKSRIYIYAATPCASLLLLAPPPLVQLLQQWRPETFARLKGCLFGAFSDDRLLAQAASINELRNSTAFGGCPSALAQKDRWPTPSPIPANTSPYSAMAARLVHFADHLFVPDRVLRSYGSARSCTVAFLGPPAPTSGAS